jgi:molecular chaperone DnaK
MQVNALPTDRGKQPAIGIDLGTTYSAIAYLDTSGRPTTITNDAGDLLTPSAVAFDRDSVLVGKEAIKSAVFEPAVFADCFKRDMGRREFRREIAGSKVPPEVLSGLILRKLKGDAERRLNCEIREAVITVPAFFDETRRRATQEAGRLAGIEVLDLINEPTAAAVAFGHYRNIVNNANKAAKPELVLVYDLGGGTFDVTVLELNGHTFRSLATDGDVQLGGRDFDERLLVHVAEKFQSMHGSDPRSDPHDAAQLWHDVQEAKHALSQRNSVVVPCIHGGARMRIDVSRDEFEQMTADLLDRTETTTQMVLRAAKLEWSAIDRVLLVGGSTRMPAVGKMLVQLSGKQPDRSLAPDEAVAHGAALYAGLLSGKSGTPEAPEFSLINVNSHSLGIIGIDQRAHCDRNIVLIPRNTALPARVVRKFATARDNQSSVKVVVVEGESERPEHCIRLGECVVRNLPPALPKGSRIDVEYSYSTNGRLSVRARVPAARQSAAVEIRYERALRIPDLDTWHKRVLGLVDPHAGGDGTDLAGLEAGVEQLMDRLDELLVLLGEKACSIDLPVPLQAEKQIALDARRALKAATASFLKCEKQQQAAVGQAEFLAANADFAKSRLAVAQAEAEAKSACRLLGEKCVEAEFAPQPLRGIYDEIKRLQSV